MPEGWPENNDNHLGLLVNETVQEGHSVLVFCATQKGRPACMLKFVLDVPWCRHVACVNVAEGRVVAQLSQQVDMLVITMLPTYWVLPGSVVVVSA